MGTTSIATRPLALDLARALVSAVEPRSLATILPCDTARYRQLVSGSPVTGASWLPQVHQVQAQAELARGVVRTGESNGINGSTVKATEMGATKRFIEGARGVPPRGRPV